MLSGHSRGLALARKPASGRDQLRTLHCTQPPCWQFADDGRLEDDWVPDEEARDPEEIEKANR